MSNSDDADKKPPPQKTVAWDPGEVPGLEGNEPSPEGEGSSTVQPALEPTQRLPVNAADSGATVRLSDDALEQAADALDKVADAATPSEPASTDAGGVAPPDAGATVVFTAEDVARLQEEQAAAEAEAAQEEDRLIGTLIRDKWKVQKKLGAGSFGTVYKVEDIMGGWVEALKILGVDRMTGSDAEEMRARFLREAQIMKRLGKDSKHIVGLSTYEEDIEAGLIYFLMEFVEGKSLADALNDDGPFPVDRTVRLALQVCDALMAAHEGAEPVVHRDLKLENLMLTTDRGGEEIVKVLDFGIAKIAEREADSRLTTVGTLGTPGYAAPEQLRAEAVDGRTDLFAFGVILYALLTGKDPWLGNLAHEPTHQIYELMVATDRAEVRPMSDSGQSVPPAMVNVVMKLLRRDPAQRFQSARELRDALLRVAEGGGDTDLASLKVITDDEGVRVEVREGRSVVAEGPTPLVANGLNPGTYTVEVRDPRYEGMETSVALGAGTMQDVTVVTRKKDRPTTPRPSGAKKGGAGKIAAAVVLLAAIGGTAWAQPWGRSLDIDGVTALAQRGAVTQAWLMEGGVEGGVQVVPLDAASSLLTPFFASIDEGDIPLAVQRLRDAGVDVDTSFEVRRLIDLAAEAQGRGRYFGAQGADVSTFALRLQELVPGSQEAASLLLKVGERMAWDAAAAVADGSPEEAQRLVDDCLELVSEHPRCVEVAQGL